MRFEMRRGPSITPAKDAERRREAAPFTLRITGLVITVVPVALNWSVA